MRNLIAKLIHIVADLVFPLACVGCRAPATLLCDHCRESIERDYYEDENISAVLSYRDPKVCRLVWLAKYRGSRAAAAILAGYLYEIILRQLEDDPRFGLGHEPVVLLPVPMTARHQRQRGWNQAEHLAEALVALAPDIFVIAQKAVAKIKTTPSQVSQPSRQARLHNLKNAFALADQAALAGRTVCVIDDVTTTGATLALVLKEAKKARPRRLFAVAAAHG